MLDHLAIYSTAELHKKMVAFYESLLEPLGYKKLAEFMDGQVVGFGDGSGHCDFWIAVLQPGGPRSDVGYAHFAFSAKSQDLVKEAYAKGIEAGGKDNGAPGPRPMYGPGYYAGFIHDPVGNGMEIIHRSAQ